MEIKKIYKYDVVFPEEMEREEIERIKLRIFKLLEREGCEIIKKEVE